MPKKTVSREKVILESHIICSHMMLSGIYDWLKQLAILIASYYCKLSVSVYLSVCLSIYILLLNNLKSSIKIDQLNYHFLI